MENDKQSTDQLQIVDSQLQCRRRRGVPVTAVNGGQRLREYLLVPR